MTSTHYLWDFASDNLLMEKDDNGNTIASYEHEPGLHGELISQRRNGQTYYYHYDGLGNTVAVTDENENVVETATYSAFGEVVQKTSSIANPFGYKGALGYYTNPVTNDLDVRGRIFKPVIARWLSVYPIGLLVHDSNLFRYVKNSPINLANAQSGLMLNHNQYVGIAQVGFSQTIRTPWDVELFEGDGVFSTTDDCKSACWVFYSDERAAGRRTPPGANICNCSEVSGACIVEYVCKTCICLFPFNGPYVYEPTKCPNIDRCVIRHEIEHEKKSPCIRPCLYDEKTNTPGHNRYCGVGPKESGKTAGQLVAEECMLARRWDLICLSDVASNDNDPECRQRARDMYNDKQAWILANCPAAGPG